MATVTAATTSTTPTELERRYRLVQLTKEELKVQTKIDDFEMWGAPALTQEQYQRKEALQRATPFSQRGSIFWALVERHTPLSSPSASVSAIDLLSDDDDMSDAAIVAGRDPICAHCESHRFDCVFRTADGALVRGYSHHIGSVFTLPTYRKQGLATFFLRQVAMRMAQLPDAVASVLYSDIGPTFYDRLGWQLHPSTIAKLHTDAPRNTTAIEHVSASAPAVGMSLFLDTTLDALLVRDRQRLETDIASADSTVFAPLTTRDSVEWQFCIGKYYAQLRGGFTELPMRCGLRLDDDAFVVWCHNFKESTLYVVRARLPTDRSDAVRTLLCAALSEARAFGLQHVAMWDPPAVLAATEVTAVLDITQQPRDDSLSSVMVFAQHSAVDGSASGSLAAAAAPMRWVANEKFAWV